jgi:protein TIF31
MAWLVPTQARAAAGNDLRGVRAYNSLGMPELYTLATVVVDYLGHRVVAQSIVPGILRRNQTCSVVYGASEIEGKMVVSDRFNALLAKSIEKLHIKSHAITYGEDPTEHTINSSAECKGILGTDERFYVLDLVGLFIKKERTIPFVRPFPRGFGYHNTDGVPALSWLHLCSRQLTFGRVMLV